MNDTKISVVEFEFTKYRKCNALLAEKEVLVALFAICLPFPSLSFAFCKGERKSAWSSKGRREVVSIGTAVEQVAGRAIYIAPEVSKEVFHLLAVLFADSQC